MNKILVLICLALLGFIAWREKATLLEWKNETGARLEKLVFRDAESAGEEPAAAPSDADYPPPGPGDSTAATPSFAAKPRPVPVKLPDPPEGVYYLRTRISVKTDGGVRGFAAGTKVSKTGENLGMIVVTNGSSSFSVESAKLTRDMNEVLEIQTKAAAGTKGPETPPPAPAPTGKAAPNP